MCHRPLYPQCVLSQAASKTPIIPREMYVPLSSCSLLSLPHGCWLRHLGLLSSSSLPLPRGPGKLHCATGLHAQGCLEVVKATWSRALVISPSVCAHTTWMGMIFEVLMGREGDKEWGREEKKKGGRHKSVKLQTNRSPYPCPLPSPTLPSIEK